MVQVKKISKTIFERNFPILYEPVWFQRFFKIKIQEKPRFTHPSSKFSKSTYLYGELVFGVSAGVSGVWGFEAKWAWNLSTLSLIR